MMSKNQKKGETAETNISELREIPETFTKVDVSFFDHLIRETFANCQGMFMEGGF